MAEISTMWDCAMDRTSVTASITSTVHPMCLQFCKNYVAPMKRALVAVAVSFVALTASRPARAEMLYLTCKNPHTLDFNITINLTNNTVTTDEGVFPAAISGTAIHFQIDWPRIVIDFLIDRTTGIATRAESVKGTTVTGTSTLRCVGSAVPPPTKF